MDQKSLEMLEFHKVRAMLAGLTSFSASRELALNLEPHTEPVIVSGLLAESAQARRLFAMRPGFSVGELIDVRPTVRLASTGRVLDPKELTDIQHALSIARALRASLAKVSTEVPSLWNIACQIVDLSTIESEISRCIAPTGEVLDSASQRLRGVRQRLRQVRQDIVGRLQSFISSSHGQKVVQEQIITEREGRYVIPLKVEFRKDVKGIVHDISNTGQTLFVEPWMTLDLGNELRQLGIEEQQEIEKVLAELSAQAGNHAAEVSRNIALAAELDLVFAKARYADTTKAIEARTDCDRGTGKAGTDNRILKLVNARHPLLKGKVVPLSVEIGGERRILVISGPNTGGKTVALKTIGLLALMTQAGMPIPASEGSYLPLFDNIFADIGDEQSIERTLSTFSWHIGNVVRIMENSSRNSLVLLDELGTSTDPNEGTALARAILYHFRDQGTMGVATTHYTDIKIAAQTSPGLQNASLDFDSETLCPTYHLTVGVPGSSNALAIAARLGLPEEIIATARALQSRSAVEVDSVLRELTLEKQEVSELRCRLEDKERELDSTRQSLEEDMRRHREREISEQQEIRSRLAQEASELGREIRLAVSELKKTTSKKSLERARKVMADFGDRVSSQKTSAAGRPQQCVETGEPIGLGDRVWLSDVAVWGTVVSLSKEENQLEVLVGNVRVRLDATEVEKASHPDEQAFRGFAVVKREARHGTTPLELDLRGKRADHVEPDLDSYLNDSFLAQLPEVRIIHGVGTGTVRQIVRSALVSHPLVKSFRPGGRGEGGDGVTMVSLSLRR